MVADRRMLQATLRRAQGDYFVLAFLVGLVFWLLTILRFNA